MADNLQTTLDTLLGCLEQSLVNADRPVRKTGVTIGPPVLGPSVCCADCDECGSANGQLVGYVSRMYPVDATTFAQQPRIENCKPGAVAADLVFELDRCHPTVDETGNPPTLEDVDPYAVGAIVDAQLLWNTFGCPCNKAKVVITNLQMGAAPDGGCSAVAVFVTVLVTPESLVTVDVP